MGYEVKNAPVMPDLSVFDRPRLCGIGSFAKTHLSPEDQATFEAALASKYSTHVIWLWCVERGLTVGDQQVYRHRQGRCCCPRHTEQKEDA